MPAGTPSHMGAAIRLLLAGVRRRGDGRSPAAVEPARKQAVEVRGIGVSPSHLQRYLLATGGSDLHRGDSVPPTYPAVWETALTLELLATEGMPFPSRGIVHVGSEIVVVRRIAMEDRMRCRVELERLEGHRRGLLLVLKARSWNESGQLCQENSTRLLMPGVAVPRGVVRNGDDGSAEAAAAPEGGWTALAEWKLRGDAGLRYARASGDFNPIHLWPWSARLLGFSRPILHGHCSLAMITHQLSRSSGRPLRRIEARFRAPLELPAEVRLEAAGDPKDGAVALRLVAPGGTEKPFVQGMWVG